MGHCEGPGPMARPDSPGPSGSRVAPLRRCSSAIGPVVPGGQPWQPMIVPGGSQLSGLLYSTAELVSATPLSAPLIAW